MTDKKKSKVVHTGGRPSRDEWDRQSSRTQSNVRPSNPNARNAARKKAVKAKRKRKRKIVLFILEILVFVLLLGVLWGVSKFNKIDKVVIDEEDPLLHIDESAKDPDSPMKGYRNIVLFGVDSREKQLKEKTRTDTIIIASINQDTGEIKMVSVLRDSYLNLGTDKYGKINSAYYYGGAKQAIGALNMNLDMDITDFVTVGFAGVEKAIDLMDGIEIDVTEAEIHEINDYQISMVGRPDGTLNAAGDANYTAIAYQEYTPVTQAGLQKLNGLQALAYMRIRHIGTDVARTNRQRTVLIKLANKAKTMSPTKLNAIAEEVFPFCSTSLDFSEVLELITYAAKFNIGENASFPFEGHVNIGGWVGKQSVVVPLSLEDNAILLHDFLFNDSEYRPSETVKKCSAKVKADTGQ